MGDALRRYYLQTLGIASYEPRFVLANAVPSVQCEMESTADETVTRVSHSTDVSDNTATSVSVLEAEGESVVSHAVTTAAKQPVKVGKIIAELETKTHRATPAQSIADTAVEATHSTPRAIKFSLSLWRVSEKLLVLDSRQVKLALPTEQLLKNILFALGHQQPLSQAEILRWPAMGALDKNNEPDEARGYVRAMLDFQFEKQPFDTLLLMGSPAGEFSLSVEEWPEEANPRDLLGKVFQHSGYRAIVLPSLSAMLQKPALKAVTWRTIQSLVGQV